MKQLVVVCTASAAILAFLLAHRYGGSLVVGILVGGYYFLKAVINGGGIAEVRVTRYPGEARKMGDPAGSIGMGLAAAGIASSAMGSPDNMTALGFFLPVAVGLGIAIAIGWAVVPLVKKPIVPLLEKSDTTNENETVKSPTVKNGPK